MRQRAPWNVKGVRPEVRDAAREAARRAGIPVGQWLDQAIIGSAAGPNPQHYQPHPQQQQPYPQQQQRHPSQQQRGHQQPQHHHQPPQQHAPYQPPHPAPHHPAPQPPQPHYAAYPPQQAAYAPPPVPQSWQPDSPYPPAGYGHASHPPAPPPGYAPMPQPAPQSDWTTDLDRAVAEISARQHALDLDPDMPPLQPQQPRSFAPPPAPRHQTPPPPPPVYTSAPAQVFAPAYADAAPLQYAPPPAYQPPMPQPPAIDLSSLERQLQGITSQIENLNRNDGFHTAIAELRKDLNEIGRTLMEAMPRRALDALDADVRGLAEKIEKSRMAGVDPTTIANMERGLLDVRDALRALTPAESLVGFEDAVRGLASKIDQIATTHHDPAAFQQLEATITALRGVVSHVASNEALAGLSEEVRGLSAKIERVAGAASGLGPEALSSLEKRIADLPVLGAIERGFGELKARIDDVQRMASASGSTGQPDLSDLRRNADRTQDTLQALQGTLGVVIERLSTIETGLQTNAMKSPPAQPVTPPPAAPAPRAPAAAPVPTPPPARTPAPEASTPPVRTLPPAQQIKAPAPASATAPAPLPVASPAAATIPAKPVPAPAAMPPREKPRAMPAVQERQPINPNLPPDFPLEPGSGAPRMRPKPSAAERIAASEAALAPGMPGSAETAPTNFIAAARRAAQAAAPATIDMPSKDDDDGDKPSKTIGQRVRALIVGGSAVIAVVGTMHVAMKIFDPANQGEIGVVLTDPPPGIMEKMIAEEEAAERALEQAKVPSAPAIVPPSGILLPQNAANIPAPTTMTPAIDPGITGSVASRSAPAKPAAPAQTPADGRPELSDRLPAPLREAALGGDAGAEYEIGLRYLEGRGIAQNTADAVRWLERAAAAGITPAQFRLGGLYEKGQGVKKNLDTARKLYVSAAEKGSAKAMHNLAVLYAEGVDGKPDYKTAAGWFRKAAEHGTADSQHNLGILYARGVGVEQNLAESYKWFTLAANQGDQDSATKRDEVAARLDQGSLMAAKLAAQTFTVKPQPDEAINVKTPPGGWERPASNQRRPDKKQKPASPMRVTPS